MRTNILMIKSNHYITRVLLAILPAVLLISVASSTALAANVITTGNNFTLLMSNGYISGGTNDVKFNWDNTLQSAATFSNGTGPSNATISSDEPLDGWLWIARQVQVVGPGTYWVRLGNGGPSANRYEVTIPTGQIGAHMLLDWGPTGQATSCGKTNCNIDVWIALQLGSAFATGKLFTGADNGTDYNQPLDGTTSLLDGRPNAGTKVWDRVSVDLAGRIVNSAGTTTITNLPLDGVPGIKIMQGDYSSANVNVNLMLTDLCADVATRCNDNNACTNDLCNTATGACSHTTVSCDDGNPCTTDTCNTVTGCLNTPKNCNDNNACTDDQCNPQGLCIHPAHNCDDGNICTTDTCNTASGCVHTNNTVACSDNNACTSNDLCSGGVCVPGAPKTCPSGVCSSSVGCTYTNVNTSGNNMTILMPTGLIYGGTNDVKFTWDGTIQSAATFSNGTGPSNATISSDEPLDSWLWVAKHVQIVGPGTYWVPLSSGYRYEATIPAGRIGAHMLMDWGPTGQATSCGKTDCDVNVWVVWNFNDAFMTGKLFTGADDGTNYNQPLDGTTSFPDGQPNTGTKVWNLVSVDFTGRVINQSGGQILNLPLDNVPGIQVQEGSYKVTNINFNMMLESTITATAGPNGTISPSGIVSVSSGETTTFTITPNVGYHISDVLVDGASVGAIGSYTFTNVTANHTIAASFAINTYTITASAGANGTISPSGIVSVNSGATAKFTMTPNTGYHVSDVLVDVSSAGSGTSYIFNNVSMDHTISAVYSINSTTTTIPGGIISSNTTWTLVGSPYIVNSTVQVYGTTTTPVTLTIEPGVVVMFNSGAGIQIGFGTNQGALVARGTSTKRITFTRSGASGTWAGITFNDGTVDSATILENADIQYCTYVVMNYASPTIVNSTIQANGVYGIYLSSASPTIIGGSLTNLSATGHGIWGSGSSPVISNYAVTIVNTANYYGVYLTNATSSLSITNSTIANGLYLNSLLSITPTIVGNTFNNVDNSPMHAGANVIGQIMNNNTVSGMTAAGRIEVVGEQVKQDARWAAWTSPYVVVSGTVSVYKDTTGPATLTIDPGVTVKFASGTGLTIGNGASQGALVARGTAANRITFTRSGTSGTWAGLTFNDGTIDGTTDIEYADIQYSTGVIMSYASPKIGNSTITDVSGWGVNLNVSNPTLDTVTITNNGTYGIYLGGSSPVITGGSLANFSATGYGIFGSGSPIISNYSISIVNTANKYGAYFNGNASGLSITNSAIANGLYLGWTNITPTITGNTFTNADNSPMHAGANIIGQIMNNNTISGMTAAGRIEVVGEIINQNARWQKWTAPYEVVSGTVSVYKDTATTATLTIDPGAVIKFDTGTGMQIGSGSSMGVLIAKGAAGNNILFTSGQATPAPGNWNGIALSGNAAGASVIEYVTVEYGGLGANFYNADLSINPSSSPIIRNCTIRNSAGSGVYVASATGYPVIMDSEITGNKCGVYSSSSNPYITNSKIYSNTTYGVYNLSTTVDVDARDNWWGAATGPTYSGNSRGTGDKINDHVFYNPWLGQSTGQALSITEARAMPLSLNPNGGYVTFTASISSLATWTITITDANNNAVNSFTGTGRTIKQKWYGTNGQAIQVADDPYYYQINAVDPANGNTASAPQGMLMVSSVVPIVYMDPPIDDQMFTGGTAINITGTVSKASGAATMSYTLDYGIGGDPASWITPALRTSTTPVTDGLIYAWDTTSLTNGLYTLRLKVTDNIGNVAEDTARVRLLRIQNAAASESAISPNGDTIKDTTTISAAFTYESAWTVAINDPSGSAVRTYNGTGTSLTQSWDGKDSTGTAVPDGTYTYRINATSTETGVAALQKTGTIIVDTTLPTASITTPASNAVLAGTVQIMGTASDANLASYRVDYGPVSGAGPWSLISSVTTSVNSGTLAAWVTSDQSGTVLVQNGNYILRLSVTDQAGNSSLAFVPVVVDALQFSAVRVSPSAINTYNSEASTISFTITSAATVTLKVIPENLGQDGAPCYQSTQVCAAAGEYSFAWSGQDDNTGKTVKDEAYLFILDASDGIKTTRYSPPKPTGTGIVSCTQSPNPDPLRNQPMTITYTPSLISRVTVSISWGSQNFAILTAIPATPVSHSYVWDVRNLSGKPLDYGAGATCFVASLLPENAIITTGDTPVVSELKTDPYAIDLSYGQFTWIEYTLSRGANVTVKLISPSNASIVLINNAYQAAGSHTLMDATTPVDLFDLTDASGKKFVVSEEGDYIVSIQAVNPITGRSATPARGSLRIGK